MLQCRDAPEKLHCGEAQERTEIREQIFGRKNAVQAFGPEL